MEYLEALDGPFVSVCDSPARLIHDPTPKDSNPGPQWSRGKAFAHEDR